MFNNMGKRIKIQTNSYILKIIDTYTYDIVATRARKNRPTNTNQMYVFVPV